MLRMYHAIVFESYTGIGGSDVQGYLAVGGDTMISRYSVSDQMPTPANSTLSIDGAGRITTSRNDLVVCGNLTFISGAVMGGGNAVYSGVGSVISEPLASLYAPGRFVYSPQCPLDFGDSYRRLKSLSKGLAKYVRTGTSVIEYT